MRKLIQLIALGAVVAASPLAAFAQEATASPSPATTAAKSGQDDAEAKRALYERVTKNVKTNQKEAYEAAKEFLQKYPNDDPQIIDYLKRFVAKYEKASQQNDCPKLIAEKKWSEAFALCKQVLASEPDNLGITMNLGYAGYLAAYDKNESFNADATNYAKQAIQMIEGGKTLESWAPFRSKDEALAYLNYAIGFMSLKTNQTEAINHFAKAAQYNSAVKTEPFTYYYIALGYEVGPYKTQSEGMAQYEGKPETPESKAALETLNQTTDKVIDAYARAVSYATDPKYQADKTKWMARLTELYKFRHNGSDAGLNEFIASVRNTPLPSPTAAAAPTAPTATPVANPATTGTDGTAPSATPTPETGTTPTTTPANTTAQPDKTTTPPSDTTKPSDKTTTTPAAKQPDNKAKP
jgi:tetratricopeptide (TPR) repeat protein